MGPHGGTLQRDRWGLGPSDNYIRLNTLIRLANVLSLCYTITSLGLFDGFDGNSGVFCIQGLDAVAPRLVWELNLNAESLPHPP